jgi:predicted kinase
MQTIYMTVGGIASGKSTWAKEELKKDPEGTTRVCRDDLRNMMSNYHFSPENEKIVNSVRNFVIQEALRRGKNVIVDETNLDKKNFNEIVKMVKKMNIDAKISEVPFYVDLETALERNAKREGSARIPDDVVRKYHKRTDKFYKPRFEMVLKTSCVVDMAAVEPIVQNESLPRAIMVDIDNTLAIMGDRSPYSAGNSDITDSINSYVAEAVKLYYDAGTKIIFCSGRMEKDRSPTVRFIEKHLPGMSYDLFLRKDEDYRKDYIVKEEIFNNNIRGKYNVRAVFDDRASVCRMWFSIGLNLFRVGDPDSDF